MITQHLNDYLNVVCDKLDEYLKDGQHPKPNTIREYYDLITYLKRNDPDLKLAYDQYKMVEYLSDLDDDAIESQEFMGIYVAVYPYLTSF